MKKCRSLLTNSQLQPRQQQEFRLRMFSPIKMLENHCNDPFRAELIIGRSREHVLKRSGTDDEKKLITDSVAALEEEARKIYKDDPEDPVPCGDRFMSLMVDYGCFVLLVALSSLGHAVKELLDDDLLVSCVEDYDKFKLFSIERQLPLVVLKELWKLSFFQEQLKSRKKWKRPRDNTMSLILYDQLVEPIKNLVEPKVVQSSGRKFVNFFLVNGLFNKSKSMAAGCSSDHQEPPTLLHALWLHHITTPGLGGPIPIIGTSVDEDDDDDDDSTSTSTTSSLYTVVRSATELHKAGITFKNIEEGKQGWAIREIKFKEKMITAELSLPSITLEFHRITWFQTLIDYESEIGLGKKNQRVVSSYLKLMRDLIREPEDARVLAVQGIVNADPEREKQLPGILQGLRGLDEVGDSQHMVDVRRKLRTYARPSNWAKVINLIVITLFLALVQTFYTILSYHYPTR